MQPNRWMKCFFVLMSATCCFAGFTMSCRAKRALRETLASMPIDISSFDVRVERKWVTIRNTSEYTLKNVGIDYEAELDNGQYLGHQRLDRWEPGGEITFVIAPPNDPGRLKTFRFTGGGDRGPHLWVNLKFSTTFDPPVRIEFQAPGATAPTS